MVQLTKKAIAESFIKLINQVPFDKITVKDIVEDCGINRNTFYYHYSDIYELMEEIFANESAKVLEGNLEYDTWQEAFLASCSFALKNKKGIYHIYNSVSRRQIDAYLYKTTGKIMADFVRRQAKDMDVAEEDIQLIADFYKCALVGLVLQWLDSGMTKDPEYVIRKMGGLLEGNIHNMLVNSQKLRNK